MTEASLKGPMLAEGRTAQVFAWGTRGDRVLKLFHKRVPRDVVVREADITRRVHAAGLPAPAIEGIAEVEGRLGIVLERWDGPSMLSELLRDPASLVSHIETMASLHIQLHETRVPGLPLLKPRLEDRIAEAPGLSRKLRDALLERLRGLPEGNVVCHGDFHPLNILLTRSGPVIIDWLDASTGNPIADLARTLVIAETASAPSGLPRREFARLLESLRPSYEDAYLRWRPDTSRDELAAWRQVNAAARLDEGIKEDQRRLLEIAKSD